MISVPKVMIFLFVILSTILFWTSSNVCRYNFTIEKRTDQLNIIAAEIDPTIPMAKVYYFKELNCLPADTEFEFQRLMSNLRHVSILVMQQLTTDIRGIRVEELKK